MYYAKGVFIKKSYYNMIVLVMLSHFMSVKKEKRIEHTRENIITDEIPHLDIVF